MRGAAMVAKSAIMAITITISMSVKPALLLYIVTRNVCAFVAPTFFFICAIGKNGKGIAIFTNIDKRLSPSIFGKFTLLEIAVSWIISGNIACGGFRN